MNRTSLALKRLGVPVLASTLLVTGAQIALGTSAFAAAGTLSHTPPNPVATGATVTETGTASAASQTVSFTVNGSATFTSGPGAGTQATSCTTGAGTSCTVTLTDAVAETVTVGATDAPAADTFANDSVTFTSSINGTLAITPNPAYGTATPDPTLGPPPANPSNTGQTPDQTVTYTPGSGSPVANRGAQTITITVGGSAKIVAPGGAQTATTFTIAAGAKSATCVTDAVAHTCKFAVSDTASEAVTVTASDSTDTTTPSTNATDNFAGLWFTNCPQTAPDTSGAGGNCVSQQAANSSHTYTVKYSEAGTAVAGRTVSFALATSGANSAFAASQPSGTTFQTGTTAVCTTAPDGTCGVTLSANAAATGTADITATTSNVAPYPGSVAGQRVNFVATTTPGRLVQIGETPIRPDSQADAVNEPGDAVQVVYELDSQCTVAAGQNGCAGNPLANTSVTLTTDHGFFTPNCISSDISATNNYANCTFNATPAAGTKVGDLKSLGTSTTVTTGANGRVTVTLGIGKDAAFDQNGGLTGTVTGSSGGSSFAETQPGNSTQGVGSNPACTAPSAGVPEAGCPQGTVWTTKARPLNGAAVSIVSIPATSSEAALSDTKDNNVPINNANVRVVVLHLTDQFGNLTSGGTGANAGVTLASTGVGDLLHCATYSNTSNCATTNTSSGDATASTITSDSSGVQTRTYTHVVGSYLSPFTSTGGQAQERYEAINTANTEGKQTIKAAWNAPVNTFNTFAAGPPAVATYKAAAAAVTDTVVINWFKQTAQPVVTFSTTPSNTVKAGTVVTVSATVKDQFGNPIQGDFVQFIRSGPQTQNGTSCSATNGNALTNASGQAGFSFTCTNPSQQVVTIIVNDGAFSGNEVARGTQTINFTGATPVKHHISATITCKSPRPHVLRCVVRETPAKAGLSVAFFRKTASGPVKIGSARTNSNGVAVLVKKNLKSHKTWKVFARVAGSGTTFPATTGTSKVTIK